MARMDPQVTVRLPAEMRERIRERAAENRRSLSAEILHCLDQVLVAEVQKKGPAEAATSPSHVTSNL